MAYYHKIHEPTELRETMRRVNRALRWKEREFTSILCTGQSGIVPSAVVATVKGKGLCILRKENEESHSKMGAEGNLSDKYIIIDDFTDSGATLRRLMAYAKARGRGLPVYVVLYGSQDKAPCDFRDFTLVPVAKYLYTVGGGSG